MPEDNTKGVSHAEFSAFGEYVNKRFDGMDRSMTDGFSEIKSAISKMQESRSTQWGPIIAAVSLMVTVGTLAFAPVWMNLQETKDEFAQHTSLDGHPRAIALHEQYGPRFEAFAKTDDRHTERLDKIEDEHHKLVERIAKREGNAFTAQDGAGLKERIGALEAKP